MVTSKFIPEKELKDRILLTRLMPNNIGEVIRLITLWKKFWKKKERPKNWL